MGEMTVKGYAERKVECDTVKYTLEFNADGLTIPDAVKKVNAELEHFLEIMEKNGITADKFEIVDNKSAEKYSHDEGKMPYYSKRIVSISMPLITQNVNSMMQYISDCSYERRWYGSCNCADGIIIQIGTNRISTRDICFKLC